MDVNVRKETHARYAKQIAFLERLHEFTVRHFNVEIPAGPEWNIPHIFLARATKLVYSIETLFTYGFVEEAQIIGRTLSEMFIDLKLILMDPAENFPRFWDYRARHQLELAEHPQGASSEGRRSFLRDDLLEAGRWVSQLRCP